MDEAGTKKNPRVVRINDIALCDDIRENILAFHTITGCDITSQFAGIIKKCAWKIFIKMSNYLNKLGREKFLESNMISSEAFFCKLCDPTSTVHLPPLRKCAPHSSGRVKQTWTFYHQPRMLWFFKLKGPIIRHSSSTSP